MNKERKPQKILIVRTDRLGDSVLSLPVIDNLRSAYPNAYLAVMCAPLSKDVYIYHPALQEVIIYDKDRVHKSWWSSLMFAWKLRKSKFDWAVILHSTNRVLWIAFFAGIPLRIGWSRKVGYLLTHRLPYTKPKGEKHERDYNLDVIKNLGVPIIHREIRLYTGKAEDQRVKRLLEEYHIDRGRRVVALHPLSSCPSRRWAASNYSQLAQRVIRQYHALVMIIGGERISISVPDVDPACVVNVSGMLTVGELAVLTKHFAVLVSNDSGPVHVAVGVKTPCVVLFGRNQPGLSPQRWGPLGKDDRVIKKDTGCQECLAHRCTKEFLCVQSISVDEVFEHVQQFLLKEKLSI